MYGSDDVGGMGRGRARQISRTSLFPTGECDPLLPPPQPGSIYLPVVPHVHRTRSLRCARLPGSPKQGLEERTTTTTHRSAGSIRRCCRSPCAAAPAAGAVRARPPRRRVAMWMSGGGRAWRWVEGLQCAFSLAAFRPPLMDESSPRGSLSLLLAGACVGCRCLGGGFSKLVLVPSDCCSKIRGHL